MKHTLETTENLRLIQSEVVKIETEETENGKKERYCNECGTVEVEGATDSAVATESGFFAKIAEFIRNIFASIFSIFNK